MNIDPSVLEGVVQFIKGTDGIMAKQAAMDAAVLSEAEGVIDSLVTSGVLAGATKEASVQKIKEDPTYMIDLLKKVASAMETIEPAGAGVDTIKAAGITESADDAFDRILFS